MSDGPLQALRETVGGTRPGSSCSSQYCSVPWTTGCRRVDAEGLFEQVQTFSFIVYPCSLISSTVLLTV